MGYVYRHVRLDKNEVFYVGLSLLDDPKYKRAYSSKGRNNLWHKITAKTEYDVHIIIDGLSTEETKEKEKEFIKIYGRINLGTGTLANLTDGGDGTLGTVFSEETRYKMMGERNPNYGKSPSEETRRKMSLSRTGRKHSEESKAKMSISQTGRVCSEDTKEKLRLAKTGTKHSEETKKMFSRTRKGKLHPNFGKKHSDETRAHWSKVRKGRKSLNREKVIDVLTKKVYDCGAEAIYSLQLGISSAHLNSMLIGKYDNWTSLVKLCDYNDANDISTLKYGDNNNPNEKIIFDRTAGIFFNSIKDARYFLSLKFSATHFGAMLKGKYPNKTSCVYT